MSMISIITPSHDTRFLKELEATILSQTYKNWEWIVLLNKGAGYEAKDKRIRIIEFPFLTDNVGMLKRYAAMQSKGDIIAEVDHDDLLVPHALKKVSEAFKEPEIGFVYSDNAKLADKFIPYSEEYGWTSYKFKWQGKELTAMRSQPIYPGRLGYIWYAPDHIRCWRKTVYDKIGGHDDRLAVCDDLELMHMTYLETKFKHIPEVLYIYRIQDSNTWLKKNALIQSETVRLYDENIYLLAERFAELNNLMKIDLCGGFGKPDGYLSIDKFGGDIVHDLENGIPLPDNSCGIVRAHDALEHIRNQQLIMSEIHRVLAPGGLLLSKTPSTDGRGAWQDPTHVSFWNQNSFWYWTRAQQAQYIRNKKLFRECKLTTTFPDDWCRQNNISYVIAHLEKIESK